MDLDTVGWPKSEPEIFIDCRKDGINPDGSVIDSEGCIWNAQWGSSRVARYGPDGELLKTIEFDAPQASCPEFGGDQLSTLFVTSARDGMTESQLKSAPMSGSLFSIETEFLGQREHKVLLS